jgi:hypothetical protein
MTKRQNIKKSDYENVERQIDTLNSLILFAYHEIDSIYNNKDYIAFSELRSERLKLLERNDEIVSLLVKDSKVEDEKIQKYVCELSLYPIYVKAMEYKNDSDSLYQAYLENIKPLEREYILNEQRITQINEQMSLYEKDINNMQERLNELWAAVNYMKKQRDIIDASFKLSDEIKMKIVKQRLQSYPIDKKRILDSQGELDAYKEARLKRYKIHSAVIRSLPRPPKGSNIPDPTGDSLIAMDGMVEEIIKSTEEKIKKSSENIRWVESRLDRLNALERNIVDLYYFNNGDERVTLQDVAKQLHYNDEYIRHIPKDIFKKLMD